MGEHQLEHRRESANQNPEALVATMQEAEAGFEPATDRAQQVNEFFLAGSAAANDAAGDSTAGEAAFREAMEARASGM